MQWQNSKKGNNTFKNEKNKNYHKNEIKNKSLLKKYEDKKKEIKYINIIPFAFRTLKGKVHTNDGE